EAAQVALMLHVLCGFSVDEVAGAFVSTHAGVEKRLTRAKHVLAESRRLFEIADAADFAARLPAVHRALYLLFNEGYHGASPEVAVRAELCREALRLTGLLLEHRAGATPATYALAALMCLGAAPLPARLDAAGHLNMLAEQDRARWDPDLMAEGQRLLERSASGPELTEYHLEAAIAAVHGSAPRLEDTNWAQIVSLYDALLALRPSPVVALNRPSPSRSATAPIAGSRRSPPSPIAIVSAAIPSTTRRWASWSCAAGWTPRPAGISRPRSPWRATPWSGNFSSSAWRRAMWPQLPLNDWADTQTTLHRWVQIVGKTRL